MEKQSSASIKNRRTASRKLPRGTVRVECRHGTFGLGTNAAISLLDVSMGGVRIVCKEAFKLKEEAEVVFQAFGISTAIKRTATVIWIVPLENGKFAAGLEFHKRLGYDEVLKLARP